MSRVCAATEVRPSDRKANDMRTYTAKPGDVQRAWHVIDAEGLVLGRMCTTVATLLRGKHKPMFTPSMDTGDHVIIINASKVVLTSGKADDKIVARHSGFPVVFVWRSTRNSWTASQRLRFVVRCTACCRRVVLVAR